ncbi:hypothetical protein AAC387_Pa05g2498 [Persea americana]
MEGFGEDEWFARDKLYHVLFCFFISIFFSSLCYRTPHPFLRRWSISLGSLVSLSAGAAKEAGDHIGLWSSSGASLKDAVADLLGILLASISLSSFRRFSRAKFHEDAPIRRVSMV